MDRGRQGVRAVIDTNVVAYYLLDTPPFAEEVRRFWRELEESLAPAVWEAELANVVWMAIRSGVIPEQEGIRRLRLAGRLGIHSVRSRAMWEGALLRSVHSGVAVYDTLFVELSVRRKLPLATFDARLLTTFPEIALRPGALIENGAR